MSVVKITIIDREDNSHELEAPTDMGLNLMELCKANELPVQGTCGGMAMCSTCHIYVKSHHISILPEQSDDELDILDQAFFVDEATSRLGCQIPIDEELEGFVAKLAPDSE